MVQEYIYEWLRKENIMNPFLLFPIETESGALQKSCAKEFKKIHRRIAWVFI